MLRVLSTWLEVARILVLCHRQWQVEIMLDGDAESSGRQVLLRLQ